MSEKTCSETCMSEIKSLVNGAIDLAGNCMIIEPSYHDFQVRKLCHSDM